MHTFTCFILTGWNLLTQSHWVKHGPAMYAKHCKAIACSC